MTSTDTVERVARAMAFDRRGVHDACEDADDYWSHTDEADKDDWRGTARAAISAMPSPDVGEAVSTALKFLDHLGTPHSEPLNSVNGYRDKGSRAQFTSILRTAARKCAAEIRALTTSKGDT